MLNDEQHEKLKKLVEIALKRNANGYHYDFNQRHNALEDIADIIDPEHWTRGMHMKTRRPGRLPDEELNDVFKPTSQREFMPRRAEG